MGGYCVAALLIRSRATRRAARPDFLGKLGTGSSLRQERLLRMTIVVTPRHGLRDHFYAGAVDQGLVGVDRGERDHSILGKAGCDFDLRKILERDFHFVAF